MTAIGAAARPAIGRRRSVLSRTATVRLAKSTVTFTATFVSHTAFWLLVCALGPTLFGWQSVALVSGSMSPLLGVGDIVVAEPYDGNVLASGAVIVFHAPGSDKLTTHRIVAVHGDGTYRTRGDANAVADSTPVPPSAIVAVGRLRVPLIGMVLAWWQDRNYPPLVVTLLCLAVAAAFRDGGRTRDAERPARTGLGKWSGRLVRSGVVIAVVAVVATHLSGAVFAGTTANPGNAWTASSWFETTPPTISGSVVAKTSPAQYLAGAIKPSGGFYVYANVTDTGTGASGVATVTANVSSIKAGATSVALVAGSFSVGGVSYGFRSAAQTADAKPAGTYSYGITAVDNAGNSTTDSSFTVAVDATAPAASDIQTTNGGTAGRPDSSDTIIFTYTEPIDPESILAGWSGGATPITVRFTNNSSNDSVAIWDGANGAQLPLGSVALNGNFVSANTLFAGTMVQSGTTITVTLGTMTSGAPLTYTAARAMSWTPGATATDAAGNACTPTSKTETTPLDIDF
jgi:signal peptidase I